jgi:hypothetical protein
MTWNREMLTDNPQSAPTSTGAAVMKTAACKSGFSVSAIGCML